jgi:hypothetical protein
MYHHHNKCKESTPLTAYYRNSHLFAINAKDVTDALHHAMTPNYHQTGITADEVIARSLRAGGASVILCGNIDMDHIHMIGS